MYSAVIFLFETGLLTHTVLCNEKTPEIPTRLFWPETSHFWQSFLAFHFLLIISWFLKLLCLTSLCSTILWRFSGVSQPFLPFNGIWATEPAIILDTEINWIISTLCKVCDHLWSQNVLEAHNLKFFMEELDVRTCSWEQLCQSFSLNLPFFSWPGWNL